MEGRSTLQSSTVSSLLCVCLGFRCLCATNHVKQHVGKGGSAVPKPEMEQGGFFSGDFNFVYSDESGFHSLQLVLGAEQQEPLQPPDTGAG